MKATGIVRRIDSLGRVVIPGELRKIYGLSDGEPIGIFTEDEDKIILRRYVSSVGTDCGYCGNGMDNKDNSPHCKECGRKLMAV